MLNTAVNILVGVGELVLQVCSKIKKWIHIGHKVHSSPTLTATKLFTRANSRGDGALMNRLSLRKSVASKVECQVRQRYRSFEKK